LGRNDRLLVWRKPQNWQRPRYLPIAVWNLIAPELTVRVLRFSLRRAGYRTRSVSLVTTLVDPERYSAQELAELYARRWQIELWFRDVKTSMGMEVLRCQSPAMIHKELEMFFIAYNLIRSLMVQASQQYQVDISRMSFKARWTGCGNSAAPLPRRVPAANKENYSTACSKPWPKTWFQTAGPPRAARRQTAAKTLSAPEPAAPPIQRRLASQSKLEK